MLDSSSCYFCDPIEDRDELIVVELCEVHAYAYRSYLVV